MIHECEECEPGMLFHNYVGKVEYFDPEANSDTIKTALYTCPNHPKANIVIESVNDIELKKKEFGCSVCHQFFSNSQNLEFHKKRTHS